MHEISDAQRDATLAALRAMNAELEAEMKMRRDADLWRAFAKANPQLAQEFAAAVKQG